MSAAEASAWGWVAVTDALAADLAAQLAPGDVVHVCGEIGAGKTTFIRGACRALGFGGPVTSPSYTLCNRYEGGPAPISHLDCQRLEETSGEEAGLLDDEIGPERITFIEWPQRSVDSLGVVAAVPATVLVELRHQGPDQRTLSIERLGQT